MRFDVPKKILAVVCLPCCVLVPLSEYIRCGGNRTVFSKVVFQHLTWTRE